MRRNILHSSISLALLQVYTLIRCERRAAMGVQSPAWWVGSLALLLTAVSGLAQGTFQNLDFESAVLVPVPDDPYGGVAFGPAFPGWTAYVGGLPLDADSYKNALYNNEFLDSSGISIVDRNFAYGSVIQGNYTAILQAGWGLGVFQPADTMLSQTGIVPSGSQSLLFEARFTYGPPPTSFGVTLGGQTLSVVPLLTTAHYTLYGADIHTWADQTADLAFTAFSGRPYIDNAYLTLDAIQFSDQPIPEPSVLALSALGALLLGWCGVRERFALLAQP
jgi:hypothetical protein